MTLTTVQKAAEAIAGNNVLSITSLEGNRAYIVRFSNDHGLRHFGQTLIRHGGGSVGLVFNADGTVPPEAEARRLMSPEDEARVSAQEAKATTERRAMRIFCALAMAYRDEPQVPAHLITHAMGDLRHLCDEQGLDHAALDENAYHIYLQEKSDSED